MTKAKANSKVKSKPTEEELIGIYMDYVLENEKVPKSVYKFSKEHNFTEQEFYQYFGSFDGLRRSIWNRFFDNAISVMQQSKEYSKFSNREKLLTFFFTFFEVLTANRSYVLFALNESSTPFKSLEQLKGLRNRIKDYGKDLIAEENREKSLKLFGKNEMLFSEGVWVQFLFILKFWMEDNSAGFERTDVAIEKSINTIFDVFDNTPLERIVDLGKFLWSERNK